MSKQSESLRRFYQTPKGIELKNKFRDIALDNKYHLGYRHTTETVAKIREAHLGKKATKEARGKMSKSHMGILRPPRSDEHRANLSASLKRLYTTPRGQELRQQIDELNRGNHHHLGHKNSPEAREKMRVIKVGKVPSEDTRLKMSETGKELWKQESHRNKLVKASRLALKIYPNKPEQIVLQILEDIAPSEWKYTGGGQVIICGRNPDFTNVNGGKACILLHGIYWHLWRKQKEHPELTKEIIEAEDRNFYKVYGWDLLIIWEDELMKHPDKVKAKIAEFVKHY